MTRTQSSSLAAFLTSLALALLVTFYAAVAAGQDGERPRTVFTSANMLIEEVTPAYAELLALDISPCNSTTLDDPTPACRRVAATIRAVQPRLHHATTGLLQFNTQNDESFAQYLNAYDSITTATLAVDVLDQAFTSADPANWRSGLAILDVAEQLWHDHLNPPTEPRADDGPFGWMTFR